MQTSFHKAFMHLDSFQAKSSFSTWFTRIVINEGLMCLRRNRTRREISLDDVKSESADLFPPEIPDRGKTLRRYTNNWRTNAFFAKRLTSYTRNCRTVVCLRAGGTNGQ